MLLNMFFSELAIIVSLTETNQQAAFAASECPVHSSNTSSNQYQVMSLVACLIFHEFLSESVRRGVV